ncbi:DUF4861 family protein [Flavicella sp.]|uniref:DUF4861 family protein n=1 Tax=Flavicella sp. TaxID=2957742 RepID=UPI00301AEDB2
MNKNVIYLYAAIIVILVSCGKQQEEKNIITVKNNLEIPRVFETVEISKSDLFLSEGQVFENMVVVDVDTEKIVVSQFVDQDGDGIVDILLFQPEVASKSEKKYKLVGSTAEKEEVIEYCYSRFVPERTDDYAWENDKVAFRVFGPRAQKMIEDDIKGGTLTSGVDGWLKKVSYPIINNWYKKNEIRPGAYHEMSPEGLDNFHVGVSRGIGGTAVKNDTTYYVSRNFTNWKTITTGPIRTSFVLDYADWGADGYTISEKKYISLDYGNNLSRYEIHTKGINVLSAGLALHENDGQVTENVNEGWVSYWEPHDTSELGTAIVAAKGSMVASEHYVSTLKDRSNLFAQLKIKEDKVVYYSGFAWKESGQYPTKESWEKYLKEFALKINNPLEVVFTR